jgi:hypothetical protein
MLSAGPPVIGSLGHRYTVLTALTAVVVLLARAELIAGSVREPALSRTSARRYPSVRYNGGMAIGGLLLRRGPGLRILRWNLGAPRQRPSR